MKSLYLILFLFFCNSCSSSVTEKSLNGIKTGRLLYQDNFEKLSSHWVIETPSNKNSKVYTDSGKLIIDVAAGATVWFNKKLSGNYLISYTRKVVVNKRVNDRLSDFNQFWMASDPKNTNLFTRTGVFEEYDSLSLYYMGMGGNTNTTTRFRKYFGDGSKPLLKEYLDKGHLLQPNKEYLITLVVKNGLSECFVNGQKYFSYKDEVPLVEGYFGFRTTWSRQEVSNFKIFSLK